MTAVKVCCARLRLHVVPIVPDPQLKDEDGIELYLALGSSTSNGNEADLVMLIDPDDKPVAAAKLSKFPELKAAVDQLVRSAFDMFSRPELHCEPLPKTDGVVH